MPSQTDKLNIAAVMLRNFGAYGTADRIDEASIAANAMAQYCAERLVMLGKDGANSNLSHPDRVEWERLHRLVNNWDRRS